MEMLFLNTLIWMTDYHFRGDIRVSNLVEPGISNKEQVLLHLLWYQSIRRVVIYDVDPVSGAVLLRLHFDKVQRERRKV